MTDLLIILEKAQEEGRKAMNNCKPTPVTFVSADLFDKPLGEGTVENEGDCGGAYITGIPHTSDIVKFFKKYAKSNGMSGVNADYTLPNKILLRKNVYKGFTLHFPTNQFYRGQSHERYKAFYEAAASVLKNEGLSCGVRDYLT